MLPARHKTWYFAIEGVNSFVTTFFFYYLYFFMQSRHGFDTKSNLALAALNGFVYTVGSWWGGRLAQRTGYFTALKLGLGIMLCSIGAGWLLDHAIARIVTMVLAVGGMSLTWPALEALVTEGESIKGIQHNVGIYNIVWAGTGAVAYFIGGTLLEKLGMASLFYVPILLLCVLVAGTVLLEQQANQVHPTQTTHADPEESVTESEVTHPAGRSKVFLHMAWVANPFAYVAINTLVAAMPTIASRLGLSPMAAGFYCSIWLFARLAAFVILWCWPAWHYRIGWLITAYGVLICGFAAILILPNLAALVTAQLLFGAATGLVYYSSLFYAMDLGETKGVHGGLHEAALGAGNCAGPAVGALTLQFLPRYSNSGAIAVSLLLVAGFCAIVLLWHRSKRA